MKSNLFVMGERVTLRATVEHDFRGENLCYYRLFYFILLLYQSVYRTWLQYANE